MNKVLLVDDSKTIILALAAILEKHGYETVSAGDGVEALAVMASGLVPNVILTDLNMPNMDGITFIREARKITGMRFTPILMLTTESQQSKRDQARAAGATGWLVKPVQPDNLLALLEQILPEG